MLKKMLRNSAFLGALLIPVSLALSCGTSIDSPKKETFKWQYQNKFFASQSELVDYLLAQDDIETIYEELGGDFENYRWKIDGSDQVFLSLRDLDQYIATNYVEEVTARISLDGGDVSLNDDFFASIPLNTVAPLQYDENGNPLGRAFVYRAINDGFYFTTDPEDVLEAEENAKKSWIEMHNAYLFNGIYFANKEDLTYYLNIKYQSEASDHTKLANLRNYQIVMDSANGKVANTIATSLSTDLENPTPIIEDEENLKKMVGYSVFNNSEKTLKIGNSNPEYLTFSEIEEGKKNTENLQSHINYWNIGAQENGSYYIVDNVKGSRGDIYGSYFQLSPQDLGRSSLDRDKESQEGIMDYRNWTSNDSVDIDALKQAFDINGKMIGSLMSMAFNTLKQNVGSEEEQGDLEMAANLEVSMAELLKLAQQSNYFDNYNIDLKNKTFQNYLNDLSNFNGSKMGLYPNLGNEMVSVSQNLIQGKRYNPFYLLPIMRNYIISRLMINEISQIDLINVNNVFIALADMASDAINVLLSPFFLNQELLDPYGITNGIDLAKIYGFENYSEKIYSNPQEKLDNAFGEGGGYQGALNKAQVYLANSLISTANKQILDNAQIIMNNFDKTLNYQSLSSIDIQKAFKDANKNIALYLEKMPDLISPFQNAIAKIIVQVSNQYQSINTDFIAYNSLIDSHISPTLIQEKGQNLLKGLASVVILDNLSNDRNQITNAINDVQGLVSFVGKVASAGVTFAKIFKQFEYTFTFSKVVPWLAFATQAISIVFDILKFFMPVTKQVVYQYVLPNDNVIFWDGGEQLTQYGKTSTTYGPDKMELANPIRVTIPHTSMNTNSGGSASSFYFNGRFYDDPSAIVVDVINTIKLNMNASNILELINSWFYDVSLVYTYNFEVPGRENKVYWENTGTISSEIAEWSESLIAIVNLIIYGLDENGDILVSIGENSPILKMGNEKWHLNLDSKYLQSIWKTSKGYTENSAQYLEEYVKDMVSTIKPIYIFQVPKTMPDGKLSIFSYELPYPYFSMSSGQIEKLGEVNENAKYQYIYDPNIDENADQKPLPQSQIIEKIYKTWAFKQFSVDNMSVSFDSVLGVKKFDDIKEVAIVQKVYRVTSPFNQVLYFWNLSAALAWLKGYGMLNAHFINEQNQVKIYYFKNLDYLDDKKAFTTIENLLNWLLAENIITKQKTGGENNV